jgi:hypothetical protein
MGNVASYKRGGRAVLLALLLCLPLRAMAQTGAADMDLLLDTGAVSFGAASLWVQSAAGLPGITGGEAAFAGAEQNGLLPAGARADEPLRLDELAFMLARAFSFKGGLMYTCSPAPATPTGN